MSSSVYKEFSYDQKISIIKSIQFSVLGPDEIVRQSVVEVIKTDTYTGNEPVIGGLFDSRMGVLEHNKNCSTCEAKNVFCPAHIGHIKLAKPVFHPMFFDTVRKFLKCVCYRCSRTLVSSASNKPELIEEIKRIKGIKSGKKRLDLLSELCKKIKRCGDDQLDNDQNTGCRDKQPIKYNKINSMKIVAEFKEIVKEGNNVNTKVILKEMSAEEILRNFQRIPDKDIELFGFHHRINRPDWMILTVLVVPPPAVRPSIIEENGQRREDDLTHKLSDIIKYNNQLKERIETGKGTEEQLKNLTYLIQYHVATFMDNQIPGLPVAQQRNGRKLKSIADRLKKKEGRIRGNLNGKRVDQSARSVITPDPYITLYELGIPLKIAMTLTFPEIVNQYNIEEMRSLIRNGPDKWPGVKYARLQNSNNVTITLKYACLDDIADKLQVGDIVDRHLRDGDYVLFNRQPSLHKMSMMTFKIRIMPFQTFRLPVTVTGPFNADFDGDEMNLFAPQNVQTMNELRDLAKVPFLIITPRDGNPIVELVQDTMLGSFRLTKNWIFINEKAMANLQMVNSYFKGKLPDPDNMIQHMFSGKQAFSQILPPGLFIDTKDRFDEKFSIVNSKLITGTIDKSVFHAMSRGIISVLFHDYSPSEAQRFLDNMQRLICRWLITAGFSVGISDLITDDDTAQSIKKNITKYKVEAYSKIENVRKGILENKSIFNNEDFFELEILNILNSLSKEVGKIGTEKINDRTNRMINMVKSGSKGKNDNVAQMVGCVGQQNVDGKRVAYGFTHRTLPHYNKYDDGPEARGFVENSFITGLTPQEVFFHAMGGREGLIDTAVKTSETGYIQRRLVKAMEDVKIYYDQTVRNAAGTVIQYLYGEDGIDGTKIEIQYIPYIELNYIEMQAKYYLRPEDPLELYLTQEAYSKISSEHEWIDKAKKHFDDIIEDRKFLINKVFKREKVDKIKYAIPFDRIIKNALKRLAVLGSSTVLTDLTPNYVLDKIDELIKNLVIVRPNQGIRFLHILLRFNLSPKVVIFENHISKPVFDWIVSEIERYFLQSIANAGEMVGIVAAQSIGEIGTQQSTPEWSHIYVNSSHLKYSGKIGEFIDKLIENNKSDIIDLGNDSCVLQMKEKDDYKILGVSENEKIAWNRISAVSRHPVNGQIMKVKTRSGRTTTCTLSHSFLKRAEKGIIPVLGSELVIGDRIPVSRYIPEIENPEMSVIIGNQTYALDKEFGWICGAYLADGSLGSNYITITKLEQIFEDRIRAFGEKYESKITIYHKVTKNNKHTYMTLDPNKEYQSKDTKLINKPLKEWIESNFGHGAYNKRVGGIVFASNKEFISGIISGYFDGDGNVSATKQMIRAHSVNEGLIDDIIVLFAYHGIFASKLSQTRNREKANVMWEVSVNKKYSPLFKETIGLYTPHKSENLDKIISYLDTVKQQQDYIDMIPELSDILEMIGRKLEFPGQSRLYGRYKRLGINKIGRDSVVKYIELFENANNKREKGPIKEVTEGIEIMKQAAASDVVYDEIMEIHYSEYTGKYVYDFTVPGNDSFMIDSGVMVHNTLDSFHSSGTAAAVKATSGVPRLKELLNVSKNIKTPSLTIYLKKDIGSVVNPVIDKEGNATDPRIQETKLQCIKIMQQLEITRLKDILESTDIYWDPPGTTGLNTGIPEDSKILEVYRTFAELDVRQRSTNPWVLRMKFNRKKMHNLGLTMMDVYVNIDLTYHQTIDSIFSDDNSDELIFRVRMTEEATKDVYPEDAIAALKAIEHNLVHNVLLKGFKNIKKVSMRLKNRQEYDQVTDKFNKIAEWVLDTDGTNLQEILANPNIDQDRTRSNDINEIFKVLGIEAARNALYEEFVEIFQSEDAVNYRHMSLLLDTMANKGILMSIDRHGINRGDVGPLAKASFEETTDMLINASMFGELDKINGVSANIMLGQMPPCGTGDPDIVLDEDLFIKFMKEMSYDKTDVNIPIEYADSRPEELQSMCSSEGLSLKFNRPPSILNKKDKSMPKPKITFI